MNVDVAVFLWGALVSVIVVAGIATGEFRREHFSQRRSPDVRSYARGGD